MHPPEVKAAALELIAQGVNDCEISRRIGVPRGTIRDWRRPTYVPRNGQPRESETCPRCWRAARPMRFTTNDYAELLATYLGDGSISAHPRTQRLRIALDQKYPQITGDVRSLLERCFPHNRIDEVQAIGCVHVSLYSTHLSCVLPQHGAGKKHERAIALEQWQHEIVEAAPWPFVRGCIRTDGCAFINRTDVHRDKPYEYLSYEFCNMSKDIVDLFVEACDRVDVFTRVNCDQEGRWDVRINRRTSVALMLENVGLKA
jgi:transposase-like protein